MKSKRKRFPRRESPDNPQNLDEEETTETVAIPHDDKKENEVCSNIIICYRACLLLKPKIHLIISIFYRGSTLKNNCYFVISLNLVFSNNFSGKSIVFFEFKMQNRFANTRTIAFFSDDVNTMCNHTRMCDVNINV